MADVGIEKPRVQADVAWPPNQVSSSASRRGHYVPTVTTGHRCRRRGVIGLPQRPLEGDPGDVAKRAAERLPAMLRAGCPKGEAAARELREGRRAPAPVRLL